MARRRTFSVVSIGTATQDVFLQGEVFRPHKSSSGFREEFSLGSKNDLEGVIFSTGGGATNASVTFARHGFKSSFLGHVGHDLAGKGVVEELQRLGVDTKHVAHDRQHGTGYSVLMLAPGGERTILTYRGASAHCKIQSKQLPKADWYYVSSLAGDFNSLRTILKYAKAHHIKVAVNPGKDELANKREVQALLPYMTILSVNKEEAAQLFSGQTSEDLVRHAAGHVPIVIITDGPKGVVATDGHQIYSAGMYENVPVIDRTGAGDAFSSGFTAALIAGQSMEQAITFASANSTSVVGKIGAKTGILPTGAKLHQMPIVVRPL